MLFCSLVQTKLTKKYDCTFHHRKMFQTMSVQNYFCLIIFSPSFIYLFIFIYCLTTFWGKLFTDRQTNDLHAILYIIFTFSIIRFHFIACWTYFVLLIQEKCADYLPPSQVIDCHCLFGDFQVTLKKHEVRDKYLISSLQIKVMVLVYIKF